MTCKDCNKEITKENVKKVVGSWAYRNQCSPCHNKYVRARYEKNKKIIKENTWFDVS